MDYLDEKLQYLLDKDAIQQVRYQFGEALDNKDWALFESLFTAEIDTDYTAWGIPVQKDGQELSNQYVLPTGISQDRDDYRTHLLQLQDTC